MSSKLTTATLLIASVSAAVKICTYSAESDCENRLTKKGTCNLYFDKLEDAQSYPWTSSMDAFMVGGDDNSVSAYMMLCTAESQSIDPTTTCVQIGDRWFKKNGETSLWKKFETVDLCKAATKMDDAALKQTYGSFGLSIDTSYTLAYGVKGCGLYAANPDDETKLIYNKASKYDYTASTDKANAAVGKTLKDLDNCKALDTASTVTTETAAAASGAKKVVYVDVVSPREECLAYATSEDDEQACELNHPDAAVGHGVAGLAVAAAAATAFVALRM